MRLLKSNYHQQYTIWDGFLCKICFWGKKKTLWSFKELPLTHPSWEMKRGKGDEKSDRAWSLQHSDLGTLMLFQQKNYLSKTKFLTSNLGVTCQQVTGWKQNSTKGHFPFTTCPALHQSLCQPLTGFPTRIHRLAQTGLRRAAAQSNN